MSIDQLRHAAHRQAYDPNQSTKIAHSAADKLRKWKKPRSVVKGIATAGGGAIPIPGVSIAVDFIVQKVLDKAASISSKAKIEGASDLRSEVKHTIKALDVSSLDRARYKVTDQIKAYNELMALTGTDDDLCELAYNLMYRYYRMQARTEVLRAQAQAFAEVAANVLAWCDEVDRNAQTGKATMDAMVKQMVDRHDEHKSCGPLCIHTAAGMRAAVSKTGYEVY